jgi:Tfp pilus assembly protein PilF
MIRTIHVPDQWTRYDRNRPEVLNRFGRIAATYPGERLAPEHLERLVFLLEEAGLRDELAGILRASLDRGKLLRDRPRHLIAMHLGEHHRDRTRDLDEALWAFRQAAGVPNERLRLRGQAAMAEALLMLGGDAVTARRLLDKVISTLAGRRDDTARLAHLRAGDACMILGEGEAARGHYAAALDLAGGPEDSKRILRKAAAMRTTLTLLTTDERERLERSLRDWEWNEPTERYGGLHRIARAKAHLGWGEPDLAARELTALLAGNPESEYADQALALLADIAEGRGDPAAASAYRERLKRDYPWSPLAR